MNNITVECVRCYAVNSVSEKELERGHKCCYVCGNHTDIIFLSEEAAKDEERSLMSVLKETAKDLDIDLPFERSTTFSKEVARWSKGDVTISEDTFLAMMRLVENNILPTIKEAGIPLGELTALQDACYYIRSGVTDNPLPPDPSGNSTIEPQTPPETP